MLVDSTRKLQPYHAIDCCNACICLIAVQAQTAPYRWTGSASHGSAVVRMLERVLRHTSHCEVIFITCGACWVLIPDAILHCERLPVNDPFQVGHDALVVKDRSSACKGRSTWCVCSEGSLACKCIQGVLKCHVVLCRVDLQEKQGTCWLLQSDSWLAEAGCLSQHTLLKSLS